MGTTFTVVLMIKTLFLVFIELQLPL